MSINTNTSLSNSSSSVAGRTYRSTFLQNIFGNKNSIKLKIQSNVAIFNNWSKLESIINQSKPIESFPYRPRDQYSKYSLSCRDYMPWEVVLKKILTSPPNIEKFIFMKSLRESINNIKSKIFLSSNDCTYQIATFSQRARDLSIYNNKYTGVVNANIYQQMGLSQHTNSMGWDLQIRNQRNQLNELIKYVKSSILSFTSQRSIIQLHNLHSSFCNSLLTSILLYSTHQLTNNNHNNNPTVHNINKGYETLLYHLSVLTNAYSLSTGNNNNNSNQINESNNNNNINNNNNNNNSISILQSSILSLLATYKQSNGNNNHNSSHNNHSNREWYNHYPLIVSVPWGVNTPTPVITGAPSHSLSDCSFNWLPRFFSPDVISSSLLNNDKLNNNNISSQPTLHESCGILYEDLESNLLWVINNKKLLCQSSRGLLSEKMKQKIKLTSKLEIRMTSSLIVIWQLVQYLRSAVRESIGHNGMWSVCLNSINNFQLSKILLKTNALLQLINSNNELSRLLSHQLVKDHRFIRSVCTITECFSNSQRNFYIYKHTSPSQVNNNDNNNAIANNVKKSINNDNKRSKIIALLTSGANGNSNNNNKNLLSNTRG
eukprot:gene6876-9418_t